MLMLFSAHFVTRIAGHLWQKLSCPCYFFVILSLCSVQVRTSLWRASSHAAVTCCYPYFVQWILLEDSYRGVLYFAFIIEMYAKEENVVIGDTVSEDWKSSHGEPAKGVPPASGLSEGPTTPHQKRQACYELLLMASHFLSVGTSGGLLWTFGFCQTRAISWLTEWLSASQEGPYSMEWGSHSVSQCSKRFFLLFVNSTGYTLLTLCRNWRVRTWIGKLHDTKVWYSVMQYENVAGDSRFVLANCKVSHTERGAFRMKVSPGMYSRCVL